MGELPTHPARPAVTQHSLDCMTQNHLQTQTECQAVERQPWNPPKCQGHDSVTGWGQGDMTTDGTLSYISLCFLGLHQRGRRQGLRSTRRTSPSPGEQESGIMVWAGPHFPSRLQGRTLPASPSFWRLLLSVAVPHHAGPCVRPGTVSLCLCVRVSLFL